MFRPTQAIVDLKRIRANARVLKRMTGNGFFCPMVKANAYGHGDIQVARALFGEGIERVGVVLVEEGLRLRKSGIKGEILVFSRLSEVAAKALVEAHLTPVLSSVDDLKILKSIGAADPVAVHLKFDTGMHRMGFSLEEIPKLREMLTQEAGLRCVGICTHLSHGSDANDPQGVTQRQIERFRIAYEMFGDTHLMRNVLNSDALLARATAHMDNAWLGARPGLGIYGLCGSPELQPAMSLVTRLDLVRRVPKGESVSYGGRWTASRPSWIGVVPMGYGDGYWRSFSNRAQMLFRGRRVPVVGTVCMDYTLLDLTDACELGTPHAGEDIVAFGEQSGDAISVIELTTIAGTIPYELVTGLSSRVPRVYT